jgi:predicted dehydrogenase
MTIGVGVIGAGFMGRTWSGVVRLSEDATLVGIAGGRRAPALAAEFGCPLFDSAPELMAQDDVDLLVITTPPKVHHSLTLDAARAGKAVLVEKPMAQTVAECQEMVDACDAAGVVLAVVSQHRYRAAPRFAKKLIDAGEIGDVTMIRVTGSADWWENLSPDEQWQLDPAQQTAFASWGAHACDIARWFAGSEPNVAFCLFGQYLAKRPPESSAMATYGFPSGQMCQIWMTYDVVSPCLGSELQFLIIGKRGMIDLDSYSTVRLGRDGNWKVVFEQPPFNPLDTLDETRLEAYSAEFANVVAAMTSGRSADVSGREGLATTRMLEAAETSGRTGLAVAL